MHKSFATSYMYHWQSTFGIIWEADDSVLRKLISSINKCNFLPQLKVNPLLSFSWFWPLLELGSLSIIIATSISAAILLLCVFTIILRLKRRSSHHNVEAPEIKMERAPSNTSIAALESRFFPSMKITGLVCYLTLLLRYLAKHTYLITLNWLFPDSDPFQAERPVIFSLKVVADATANFDEKRKIGEGGYGSVYLGFIGAHVRLSLHILCGLL